MDMDCSTAPDTFFVIVEQLTQKVCKVEGVSISHVDFIILLAQDN